MLKTAAFFFIFAFSLAALNAAERNPYGGWNGLAGRKSGFFHVEKIDARWWCVDPTGAGFFAIGTDHVNYNVHWCEALGYAPYAQNVRKKYNDDESAWAKSATDRLKAWNFNALGANNSPSTRSRGLAYMGFLGMGAEYAGKDPIVERVHWTGFPNVFSPKFAEFCEEKARKECAPAKDDPWLFGWFIDNELEWFGKTHHEGGVADEAIKRPAEHDAKKALVELLRGKYTDINRLNSAWGTAFKSWDDALSATSWNERANEQAAKDKIEFVRLCAERYFAVASAAIRKADPNHMILGCRFAGNAPSVWDIAGKYCDIVSLNYYGQVDLETLTPIKLVEDLTRWYKQAKRPLMITEWSFPALDAGLPSKHGAGMRVRTQEDKAKCFEVYQKTFFSLPFMVGSDYFMWVDEPALGIAKTFPEDSNYGLVDVNDDPWLVFTQAVTRVNAQVYGIHSGRTSEVSLSKMSAKGRDVEIEVENSGEVDARTSLDVRVGGGSHRKAVTVPAGERTSVRLDASLAPGAHFVEAEVDPEGELVEVRRGDNHRSQFVYVAGKKPAGSEAALGVFSPAGGRALVMLPLSKVPGFPKSGRPRIALLDARGTEIAAEVHDLDRSGTVTREDALFFEADLKPGSAGTYYLDFEGEASPELVLPREVQDYSLSWGNWRFEKTTPGGAMIERITFDGIEIGSLEVLMQEVAGGTWWHRPDKLRRMTLWDGKLSKRLEVTTASEVPSGVPSGPFAYEATYALTFFADRPWFSAQFLSLAYTDSRPWTLASYFYCPQSAIGGSSDGDEADPVGAGGTAAWTDAKVGACYGVVAPPSSGVQVNFWKDDMGNEHSDVRAVVGKLLRPGETYSIPGEPVHLFCARTKADPDAWRRVESSILSLPRSQVFPLAM